MVETRHTANTITDDELDRLYAERDKLRQEVAELEHMVEATWLTKA